VFDPVVDVENARRDPELFLDNHRTPLILDEIQYAPELVAAIKRRVDRNRIPGQYLLTGSQQWGVLRSLAESLAGRVVFLDLGGFCLAEIAGVMPSRPWLAAWLDGTAEFLKQPPRRLPRPVSGASGVSIFRLSADVHRAGRAPAGVCRPAARPVRAWWRRSPPRR
jgi:hypothetical protein